MEQIIDPIGLHRVARAIGGGLKPWGRILGDLLNGGVRYAASAGSINKIVVPAAGAAKLLKIEPVADPSPGSVAEWLSQRDAAEILNLPLKHAAALPSVEGPEGATRISLSQVLALARERVTLAELSARTGIHGTRLQGLLDEAGCPRTDELGWMRSHAIASLPSAADRSRTWKPQ
jgi:hypothetical protein